MKAILLDGFGGAENMRLRDVDMPRPGAGQILIKVAATSVNRPDVIQRQGNYPPPKGESEILGLEAAGTVEAVGDGVTGWQVGDRVLALLAGGGYAEYAVAQADHAMPVPAGMDFSRAACVCETYLTAYLNLFLLAGVGGGAAAVAIPGLGGGDAANTKTDPAARQTVLIHGGSGGIGTAAIQLCRALADAQIIATASNANLERVAALGADRVSDYRREDFAERVREVTNNRGADVILDHIGGPYLQSNMRALAVGGTLMLIGVLGGAKAELNLAQAMVKRQRIIGSVLRSRPRAQKAALIAKFAETVLPLFAAGGDGRDAQIAPLIAAEFPLAQAAEAHRAMESGGHFGKIVLRVQG
ncbi:MAG: NAD(P)H-quinone oxidoreductase [Gammaproteobacteria bacterium]|nr:NAD(P)H-quinone oxidoreductase [Gammaproteobacteria bacterium]